MATGGVETQGGAIALLAMREFQDPTLTPEIRNPQVESWPPVQLRWPRLVWVVAVLAIFAFGAVTHPGLNAWMRCCDIYIYLFIYYHIINIYIYIM